VPEWVRTAKTPQGGRSVRDALLEHRRTLIGYDLGFDSVFPGGEWTTYDVARLEKFPTEAAWPDVLGHVDTDPDSFRVMDEDSEARSKTVSAPNAFLITPNQDLTTEGYTTLLFLKGIGLKCTVLATS
jgi:hypothetical protein